MDVAVAWIISPHASTRQLVGLNLNRRGLRVLEAASPDELRSSDMAPHLIVVDVDPPNGSDWGTVSLLRKDSRLKTVPLVLLLADKPTSSRLAVLDPIQWTGKPVDVQALLALVQKCLSRVSVRSRPVNGYLRPVIGKSRSLREKIWRGTGLLGPPPNAGKGKT